MGRHATDRKFKFYLIGTKIYLKIFNGPNKQLTEKAFCIKQADNTRIYNI